MNSPSQFNPHGRQETQARQQSQRPPAQEFMAVEDLLRHDAAQTPVPPNVAGRLRESLAREPRPAASWWRRLLPGGK